MGYRVPIYRKGAEIGVFLFSPSCRLTSEVSRIDELSADFSSVSFVRVMRGDYIVLQDGRRMVFADEPTVEMRHTGDFRYTSTMKGVEGMMESVMFMFCDTDSTGTRVYSSASEFDLTANAREFVSLVVRNINRVSDTPWTAKIADSSIDLTEMRDMAFSNQTCMDALDDICDEFGMEWEFDFGSRTLSVCKSFRKPSPIVLSYPFNLLSPVKADMESDDETCTRLFVFGGERNIPDGYNGGRGDRLVMPNGDEFLEREADYVIERSKTFDEVYPRRNGHVGGVSVSPNGIHYMQDGSIDFDLNDHLTDKTAKIAFTSGMLVGYEFEIASYDHASRTVEIKQQTDGDVVIPNDTMRAKVGDTYVFLDIIMPSQYVTDAENELKAKATEYFLDKCVDKMSVSVEVSTIWLAENDIGISKSMVLRVKADSMGIDSEIPVTKVVSYPFDDSTERRKVDVTLANFKRQSKIRTITSTLGRTSRRVNSSLRTVNDAINTNTEQIRSLNDSVTYEMGDQ